MSIIFYCVPGIPQLENVAIAYGKLQTELGKLKLDIKRETEARSHVFLDWLADDRDLFGIVEGCATRATEQHPEPIPLLFRSHAETIRKAWSKISGERTPKFGCHEPLLYDVHPHNTFFRRDECILIYDYESVSRAWPEELALAYATHRFSREYIRRRRDHRSSVSRRAVAHAAEVFMDAYHDASGQSVKSGANKRLANNIRAISIAKLVRILCFYHRIAKDPGDRSPKLWHAELRKFITCLKEADYYEL